MTQFNNVSNLRNFLATLLADDLGEFGNGIARIWVQPPNPPGGTESGLECIIQRTPETELKGSSGNQKKDLRRWVVTLTNFADDGSLDSAMEKIKASNSVVLFREPRYTPPSTENYESVRLELFDPILLTSTD